MKMRLHHFDLPLRHTFTISRGSLDSQPTLIVELSDGLHRGYGEATTNSYYGVTLEGMVADLEAVREAVESYSLTDPAAFWHQLREPLADAPFAHCALDQAAYDLWGKQHAQPLYQMWGLEAQRMPVSNYTIGIDSVDKMVAKMNEFGDWPVFKVKLGTDHDVEIIRQLREHTDAVFRVDANCGWSVDETLANADQLRQLDVEFIEQPLPAEDWEGMRTLYQRCSLPLIADESCQVEADVDRCHEHFHGVNIKLVKCGGLTPARRMIAQARSMEMQVMVGCMTESTVGISAIAQLLPLLDYVDMDGAVLLARDIASGITLDRGVCHFAYENGSGVRLFQDRVYGADQS